MFAMRGSVAALVAAAVLGACSSSVPLNENKAQVEDRKPNPVDPNAGKAGGADQSKVASVDLGAGKSQAEDSIARTVYFDFDSYVVKDEFRPVIEAHAKRLSGDRKKRVTVEGHTDERGGSEYNLALGQRRAEAVKSALQVYGVRPAQVETVSFGKERPKASGHEEPAWAQNRRADIVYVTTK